MRPYAVHSIGTMLCGAYAVQLWTWGPLWTALWTASDCRVAKRMRKTAVVGRATRFAIHQHITLMLELAIRSKLALAIAAVII